MGERLYWTGNHRKNPMDEITKTITLLLGIFPRGLSAQTLSDVITEGFKLERGHASRAIRLALEEGVIDLGDHLQLVIKDHNAK